MIQDDGIIDILLIESSTRLIEMFEELSRIFNLNIKFARNINEFIEIATKRDFRFALCNLHIEYKFAGLFVSRMTSNIKKLKSNTGSMYLFSMQNNESYDLSKMSLDDFATEKFSSFYNFLRVKFPLQFFHYFSTEEFKQSLTA